MTHADGVFSYRHASFYRVASARSWLILVIIFMVYAHSGDNEPLLMREDFYRLYRNSKKIHLAVCDCKLFADK